MGIVVAKNMPPNSIQIHSTHARFERISWAEFFDQSDFEMYEGPSTPCIGDGHPTFSRGILGYIGAPTIRRLMSLSRIHRKTKVEFRPFGTCIGSSCLRLAGSTFRSSSNNKFISLEVETQISKPGAQGLFHHQETGSINQTTNQGFFHGSCGKGNIWMHLQNTTCLSVQDTHRSP